MNKNTASMIIAVALLAVMTAYLMAEFAYAAPTGAKIMSNQTVGAPTRAPESRADPSGTITTIVLNSIQQDYNWKAYVGNVTGRLSLDNADGFTIYDWPVDVSNRIGEVYISRSSSLLFANVSCANAANISAEEGRLMMSGLQSDSINKTFNWTSHQPFVVGSETGITTFNANTCRSTATYVGGANVSQTMDGGQIFQEILLQDANQYLIYVGIINATRAGYDGRVYDFQMIVPESNNGTITTYYFFTELG